MKKVFLIALIASSAVGTGALTTKAAYAENLNTPNKDSKINNNIDAQKKNDLNQKKENSKEKLDSSQKVNDEVNIINKQDLNNGQKTILKIYEGLYGEQPSMNNLNQWAEVVNNGQMSIAQILVSMIHSSKFENLNYSNANYVNSLYKGIIGNNDNFNKEEYINKLDNGASKEAILVQIFNSEECQNTLKSMNVENIGSMELGPNNTILTTKINKEETVNTKSNENTKKEVIDTKVKDNSKQETLEKKENVSKEVKNENNTLEKNKIIKPEIKIVGEKIEPKKDTTIETKSDTKKEEVKVESKKEIANKIEETASENKKAKSDTEVGKSEQASPSKVVEKNSQDKTIKSNLEDETAEKVSKDKTIKQEANTDSIGKDVKEKDVKVSKEGTKEKTTEVETKAEDLKKENINDKEKKDDIKEKDEHSKQEIKNKEAKLGFSATNQNNLNNAKELILRMYAGFYNRKPTEGSLDYWANLISTGQESVAQVIIDITNSSEFKWLNYDNSNYVNVLCEGILGNSNISKNQYVYELDNGISRSEVLAQIFNSSAWQGTFKEMNFSNIGSMKVNLNSNEVSTKAFVKNVYKGILRRPADQGGLDAWTKDLHSGNASVGQMLEGFITSHEFIHDNWSNKIFVEGIYIAIYGEIPESNQVNYYVNILNDGGSKEYVLNAILQTPQAKNYINTFGLTNIGSVKVNISNPVVGMHDLLDRIYNGILNRNPGQDGLNAWSKAITSNNVTVAQVLTDTVNSNEFKNDNFAPKEFINNVYKGLLRRNPTEQEINYWMNQIANGDSDITVVESIFNSTEFQDYLNSIGMKNRGTIDLTTKDQTSKVKQFLENVYESVLHRKADQGGLNAWTNYIVNKNGSIANVINSFFNCNEFKNKNFNSEEILSGIYNSIDNQIPNNQDLKNYYLSLLNNGVNPGIIINDIIKTTSAQDYIKSFGITNIGTLNESLNNNLDSTKAFIKNVYEGILRRPADQGGLDAWTTGIHSGSVSVSSLLEGFINSNEFLGDNWSPEIYVKGVYKAIYGYLPQDNNVTALVNLLEQGASKEYIINQILSTSSAQNAIKSYGLTNIGQVNVTLKNNVSGVQKLLTRVYEGILDRKPDKPGMAYWAHQIYSQNSSVANVIQAFMNSSEFQNDKFTPAAFISNLYEGLLNKSISQQELNSYLEEIKNGDSEEVVLKQVFNSSEFQQYLNIVGITNKGEIKVSLSNNVTSMYNTITQFYKGLYNREPGQAGLAWAQPIINKQITIAQMFEDCLNSSEFKGQNFNPEQYVTAIITALTGQSPSQSEVSNYLQKILNGQSEQSIVYDIFNSNATQTIFKNAGYDSNIIGNINQSNATQSNSTGAQAVIINFDINLRQGPSINTGIITTIPIGSHVTVIGRGQGEYYSFYEVEYLLNGKIVTGYIATSINGVNTTEMYSDKSNEFLGVLSAQYESNGDPGSISNTPGDAGGASYGAWQFSSNMGSLAQFVNWLQYHNGNFYNALTNAENEDGGNYGNNFNNTWVSLANNDYNEFYNLQHQFVMDEFYDPLVSNLESNGNLTNRLTSFAVRNVLWSTAVQNGVYGATQLISHFENVTNIKQFIIDIYHQRGLTNGNGGLVYFPNCSPAVQQAVANRFRNELKQALNMYQLEVQNNVL